MDMKSFWHSRAEKKNHLRDTHQSYIDKAKRSGNTADLQGQPGILGSLYIASLADESLEIPGGVVVEATLNLAALRIVEKSHRLATAEEIAKYKERLQANATAIAQAQAQNNNPGRQNIVLHPITPRGEK